MILIFFTPINHHIKICFTTITYKQEISTYFATTGKQQLKLNPKLRLATQSSVQTLCLTSILIYLLKKHCLAQRNVTIPNI